MPKSDYLECLSNWGWAMRSPFATTRWTSITQALPLQPVRFANSTVHAGRRHEPELHCEPLVRQRCKRIYKLVLQGQSDRFVSYATAMHIESCEQVPVILQSTKTTVG